MIHQEKIFNEDHLLHLCKKYGLNPSKSYGQNFLIDPEVIDQLIIAADLSPTDQVVEVGPGFGVLTTALIPLVQKLTSFEIEKKIEPYWTKELKKYPNLAIIWGNVLRSVPSFQFPVSNYKVVANLPYQITSRVLQLFLTEVARPELIVVMVQKEVAERICAQPGDLSILALTVQYYGAAEYIATIPRAAFWPSPQVDSAILKITTKTVSAADQTWFEHDLLPFIKIGFSNRRKLLSKNLKGYLTKEQQSRVGDVFATLGLSPLVRAQELSLANWVGLYKNLFNQFTPRANNPLFTA